MTLGGLALAQGGLQALARTGAGVEDAPGLRAAVAVGRRKHRVCRSSMLPDGFRYVSFGGTRDPMDDGVLTRRRMTGWPSWTPGIAASCSSAITRSADAAAAYTPTGRITYDPSAGGGTTNLDVRHSTAGAGGTRPGRASSGTTTNCAGGATYAKSWLTCEETLDVHDKPHGWVFEAPAARQGRAGAAQGDGALRPRGGGRRPAEAASSTRPKTGGTAGLVPISARRQEPARQGWAASDAEGGRHVSGRPARQRGRGATFEVGVGGHLTTLSGRIGPGTSDTSVSSVRASTRAAPSSAGSRARPTTRRISAVYIMSTDGGQGPRGPGLGVQPARRATPPRLRVVGWRGAGQSRQYRDERERRHRAVRGRRSERPAPAGLEGLDGHVFPIARNNVVLHGEKNGFAGDFRGFEWAGDLEPHGKWLFDIQTGHHLRDHRPLAVGARAWRAALPTNARRGANVGSTCPPLLFLVAQPVPRPNVTGRQCSS